MPRKKDFNFDEMLGVDTSGPAIRTGNQEQFSTGIQEAGTAGSYKPDGEGGFQSIIEEILASHVGLKTGLAKKTTFDFTPEFARALKRWSVDVDMPMRDLVVKAVIQAIPTAYLQKYRDTGIQE